MSKQQKLKKKKKKDEVTAHLNFKGFTWNSERLVCTCVLGPILDHHHLHSSSFLHKKKEPHQMCDLFKRKHVVTDSLLTTWRLLMVSPPFPMTSPALEAGIIISWTVIPGPSLGLNAGAGRPFSTISVKSLFAVLMKIKLVIHSLQRGSINME